MGVEGFVFMFERDNFYVEADIFFIILWPQSFSAAFEQAALSLLFVPRLEEVGGLGSPFVRSELVSGQ